MEMKEGNKLIAEFMGWETWEYGGYKVPYSLSPPQHTVSFTPTKDLKFHSSWDWLMPVVEKISEYHYPSYYSNGKPEDSGDWDDCAYLRTFGMRDKEGNYMVRFNAGGLFDAKTLIEATWLAVIDSIQFFNHQTQ